MIVVLARRACSSASTRPFRRPTFADQVACRRQMLQRSELQTQSEGAVAMTPETDLERTVAAPDGDGHVPARDHARRDRRWWRFAASRSSRSRPCRRRCRSSARTCCCCRRTRACKTTTRPTPAATLPGRVRRRSCCWPNLEGVEQISPKLSVPAELNGQPHHAHGHSAAERIRSASRVARRAGVQQRARRLQETRRAGRRARSARPRAWPRAAMCQRNRRRRSDVAADVAQRSASMAGQQVTLLGQPFRVAASCRRRARSTTAACSRTCTPCSRSPRRAKTST